MPTLGYLGEKIDLLIKQGGTFGPYKVTAKNPDGTIFVLTGCQLRGQIRKKALDTDVVAQVVGVITDAANGKFEFGLTAETTAAMPAGETIKETSSMYVWDFEVVDNTGRQIPLYYGDVKVFREVTRVL